MHTSARDWDAKTYDRVSDPQFNWGMEVLGRLELRGDEQVIDAGAGSGRVTAELIKRVPDGRVLALDGSPSMIAEARKKLGDAADYLVMDLAELAVDEPADVVFSTATFHWVADHESLFRRIHASLKPGGLLHAQCGGAGNVARLGAAIAEVGGRPEFAPHLTEMEGIWNFADAEQTAERLRDAGFEEISTFLEPKPLTPPEPREFMRTVTLGPILDKLPAELHDRFIDAIVAQMGEPVTLHYVRLNISARRPR